MTSEFDVGDSLVPGLGPRYRRTMVALTGAQEQFWPDDIPEATNDSLGISVGVEPRLDGCKSASLTNEPWLLLCLWKSARRRRKHCMLAVVRRNQKFSLKRAWDGQNLISWRWSLPSPTDPVWWRSMHAISSYRGNRPTNKQTHRQDWLQYTVPRAV